MQALVDHCFCQETHYSAITSIMSLLAMLDRAMDSLSVVSKLQIVAGVVLAVLFLMAALALRTPKDASATPFHVEMYSYFKFIYANFLKPQSSDHHGSQQGALESFYNTQVRVSTCFTHSYSDSTIWVG